MLLLALAALASTPTAVASIELWLRQVLLRESSPPAAIQYSGPLADITLEDAQARVDWQIRQPEWLPPGYVLAVVQVGRTHQFALGPTVVLRYRRTVGTTTQEARLVQLQPAMPIDEPVAPDAARQVPVGSSNGLLIDGMWANGSAGSTWIRGTLLRLIVELDDLLVQVEADPRDGWTPADLVRVAEALR